MMRWWTTTATSIRPAAFRHCLATRLVTTTVRGGSKRSRTTQLAPVGWTALSSNTASNNSAVGSASALEQYNRPRQHGRGFRSAWEQYNRLIEHRLGSKAGINLTTGSNNIDIGATAGQCRRSQYDPDWQIRNTEEDLCCRYSWSDRGKWESE